MIIQISKHAQKKMDIEGIDLEQIKTTIKMGSTTRQTDGYLAIYTHIRVAYKKIGDLYRIKTVFVEK